MSRSHSDSNNCPSNPLDSLPARISAAAKIEIPSWYVTNGEKVVGPVNTGLLLRGLASGKVKRECAVARHSWSNWRPQNQIREIRALRRWQFSQRQNPRIQPVDRALRSPRIDAKRLADSKSSDHLLGQALQLAIASTRASVGVFHEPKAPFIGLVTSWAQGPGMGLNIGEVVASNDEARMVANDRQATIGSPDEDEWARASARRLTSRVEQNISGIALVPVQLGDTKGLLELGRYDHPFRQSDRAALDALSRTINQRLQQLHVAS